MYSPLVTLLRTIRSGFALRWITELGVSDVFGEVGVVFRLPRIATVVTSSFVDLYVLTRTKFEEVVLRHPELLHGVIKLAHARLAGGARRK
eukprot:1162255-Prorocentrum_minimum.AAC.1